MKCTVKLFYNNGICLLYATLTKARVSQLLKSWLVATVYILYLFTYNAMNNKKKIKGKNAQ